MFFTHSKMKNALSIVALSIALSSAGAGVASAASPAASASQGTSAHANTVSPRGVYSAHATTKAERAHSVTSDRTDQGHSTAANSAASAAGAGPQTASDYAQ